MVIIYTKENRNRVPFVQICKYKDGSISYYVVDMDKEDDEKLWEILEKYSDRGFSCRGPINGVMDELRELLCEIKGWY